MKKFSRNFLFKECKRRLRLTINYNLNAKNKIKAINTGAAATVRYQVRIIDWSDGKREKIGEITRKLMAITGLLHPKSDVDCLHLSSNKGGKGLISSAGSIRGEKNNLGWYSKNLTKNLIKRFQGTGTIKT